MRTVQLDKEGKGGDIMGKQPSDTLKPGCCSGSCFIWELLYLLLQLWIWTVLRWLWRLEELSIIIGLVNPWPVPFQHQSRTSHPIQMASRTISSNHWSPHKWGKFHLRLHLRMITDPNASDNIMDSCFKPNCYSCNARKKYAVHRKRTFMNMSFSIIQRIFKKEEER